MTQSRKNGKEESIQERYHFLRDIFEGIQDGIVVLSREMRIVSMNVIARNLFGEDSLGRQCHEVFYGRGDICKDCPALKENMGTKHDVRMMRLKKDKVSHPTWLEVHSSPLWDRRKGRLNGLIKTFRDITPRVLAERALDVTRRRLEINFHIYRALLEEEKVEDVVMKGVKKAGDFLACDRVSFLEIEPETWKAKIVFVKDENEFEKPTAQFEIDPGNCVCMEMFDRAGKGREFYIRDLAAVTDLPAAIAQNRSRGYRSVVFQPLISKGALFGLLTFWSKRPDGFCPDTVETMRSIADSLVIAFEKKRLSDQNRAYLENLETLVGIRTRELQKAYEEMEAFTYTVTHDLRAPLRALQGFSSLLIRTRSGILDPEASAYLKFIQDSAQRMDELINDLLSYTSLGRKKLRKGMIEVGSVVKDSLEQMAEAILTSRAGVKVEIPEVCVLGHRQTLIQVISNIVSNALKFVPSGTVPELEIYGEEKDGSFNLWFRDNGIGIDPEHHERIFQVFERLHGFEEYPGTGIGLAIAKRGIERMGGYIGVISEKGKGSLFWIKLPLKEAGRARDGESGCESLPPGQDAQALGRFLHE